MTCIGIRLRMGVQGLTTLIDSHPKIYRDVRFRGSRLVIDGCNLIYLLYFGSGLDQNHGGDYAAFEDVIERFISALRVCGITPYVVLDGGADHTDKKLQTLRQRAVDRIKRAHEAAVSGRPKMIMPQMTKLLFKQTLARLEVPVARCYAEADQEIAALACEWQCPVLSNDSDFYIFDLPAGLLPISYFQWQAVEQMESHSYIPCKSYYTTSFSIIFNIQRQLLPPFAALAGNDYVKLQKTESIKWTQFAPAGDENSSRLEGLLCWLRRFGQPREALEAAVGLMGNLNSKRKAEVLQGLCLGMGEYQVPPSSLKRFFIHGTAPPLPAAEKMGALVPDWTRLLLMQARLTADVLDVLLLQRMDLSIPVDHSDMPSANLTSRPLRQVMYGLLLSRGKRQQVQERDREGLELKLIPVQPAFRGVALQMTLGSLHKAEPSERLQVLMEALGVPESSLKCLSPQLRLLVAVTIYWLKRARPPPNEQLLKALLLGVSNGDSLRQRGALQTWSNKKKLDYDVTHAFNQWQACMKDSIHLNQLLGCPLLEPQVARLYDGTLVHHLVHMMKTGTKLKSFLKSHRSGVRQYNNMLKVIHQLHTQEASKTQSAAEAARQQRRALADLTANLQQLFLLSEDDEEAETEVRSVVRALEDEQLNDLVSVKTRYRVKERNNRSNNPELSRKEEYRRVDII